MDQKENQKQDNSGKISSMKTFYEHLEKGDHSENSDSSRNISFSTNLSDKINIYQTQLSECKIQYLFECLFILVEENRKKNQFSDITSK